MKVLLDACVSRRARDEIASAGHEVEWVGAWDADPGDDETLARAHAERSILVTLDKDFGESAIVRERPHAGIVKKTRQCASGATSPRVPGGAGPRRRRVGGRSDSDRRTGPRAGPGRQPSDRSPSRWTRHAFSPSARCQRPIEVVEEADKRFALHHRELAGMRPLPVACVDCVEAMRALFNSAHPESRLTDRRHPQLAARHRKAACLCRPPLRTPQELLGREANVLRDLAQEGRRCPARCGTAQ